MKEEEVKQHKQAVKDKFAAETQNAASTVKPYEIWKRRAYIVWTLIGVGVIIAAVLYICGIIWQAVGTIVIAALVVFLFHGLVDFLERKRVPRVIGALISILGLIGILAVFIISIIPSVVNEVGNLVEHAPVYAQQANEFFDNISANGAFGLSADQITTAIDAISGWLSDQGTAIVTGMANGLIGGVVDFGTWAMVFFIAILCAFWILIDLPKISQEVKKLIPEDRRDDAAILGNAFGTAVYGWLKATLICALINGVASFIVFTIAGLPYAALLGFLCGILYVIPYIGVIISAVLAGLVGLIVSPLVALIVVLTVALISNVVGNLIAPRLMKNSVNLHPALVLIVIMIGGGLLGATGMLLSIPVAAALQGVFITYFEAKTGREISSKDGALFKSVDS